MTQDGRPETYFASAERASDEQVLITRQEFLANPLAVALLESIPDLALVLNRQRQVVAYNARVLQALGIADPEGLLGQRPGEIVKCVHSQEMPGGCGTSSSCSLCGAVNTVLEALDTRGNAVSECRIRTQAEADGGALDLEVQGSFLALGGSDLVIVAMRDISAEKRRSVLERVFFHDVLNVASGLQAIAMLLTYDAEDPEVEEEYKRDLLRMSEQIADEIQAQRQLLAAEQGQLDLTLIRTSVADVIEAVAELYRNHSVARGRTLVAGDVADIEIETDPTLLRRVLGNLVKNALEATAEGETVRIDAEDLGDHVALRVNNPTVMPEEIQKQIFQRSFSTKGGSGRGIGTHSVKLLTERYLGGEVSFVSASPGGTTFMVMLPKARRR